MGMDRAAGNKFTCRAHSEADMLFGPKQDDVRQSGFDRIANPARPVGSRGIRYFNGVAFSVSAAAKIAQMRRINRQITRERSAERFVGGDQNSQSFIDLAIHALAALLNREHHHEAYPDADERHQRQTDQRDEQTLP